MKLLSNALFRDSIFKKDCEKKINYLDVINSKDTDNVRVSSNGEYLSDSENKTIVKISNSYNKVLIEKTKQ